MPGDIVLLEAGAEFVGNFVLPVKTGERADRRAVARAASAAGGRPAHSRRRTRRCSRACAPPTRTRRSNRRRRPHWQLRYLEFAANQDGYGDIIQIGDGSSAQNTLARVPHDFVLSHLYVHGDALWGRSAASR